MDTLQAAVLLAKLPHYPEEIAKRQAVAERYTKALSQRVTTPLIRQDRESVWAQYSIRVTERDRLRQRLSQAGVPTAIHYPKPLHLQECFAYLGYAQGDFPVAERVSQQILSLPMNPFLTPKEQDYICQTILKEGDNSGPAGDR
jgi:UDP-2-acetamido-2-deoxy-ribo-hexuluronate aminotransferase